MSNTRFFVVQVGYAAFGVGATPEAAVACANRFLDRDQEPLNVETIPRYVGTANTGDWAERRVAGLAHRKAMTDQGELTHGSMVLMDAETAAEMGYDWPE